MKTLLFTFFFTAGCGTGDDSNDHPPANPPVSAGVTNSDGTDCLLAELEQTQCRTRYPIRPNRSVLRRLI